jgi:hypothetical protein
MAPQQLYIIMKKIILAIIGLSLLALVLNCGGPAAPGSRNDSPTEAYKRLYNAVKSKDTEAIKREMTAKSIEFAKMAAAKNNTPIEKVFENGFTATTFAEKLPEIRDQRIVEDQGAVEVWNSKDSKWEDLPFIREDGIWKFAVGDLFAGSFKTEVVGRGRSFREAEAANAAGKGPIMGSANLGNAVANANSGMPSNAVPMPGKTPPQGPPLANADRRAK